MPERLDFKAIAEAIDIFDVAAYAGLTVVKNRAHCPVCDSDRAIEFYPETNTFHCHSAKAGSDCISLLAHVKAYQGQYKAAKELHEHFLGATAPETAPQKPEGRTESVPRRTQPASPKTPAELAHNLAADFNPELFASKLVYSEEVAALGISQADAATLNIGFCNRGYLRGRVCFPVRHPNGQIAGFIGVVGTEVKVPKTWCGPGNIVPLRRA